ncbi:MAG: NTP transferase domain-containing protein [Candidatus Sumerlaeota bacterium]|nr:NTP transferase domain-containing protein [Candidatus Sumerlaeota bacterium]
MQTNELLRETAAAILCGGQGSRMKSADRHKVCFPIDGVPAIVRTVRMCRQLGARRIVLVVGALAENVIRCVGQEFPEVVYVYQDQPLGTGHAARLAVEALREFGHRGPTLITMGDKAIEPRVIEELAGRFARDGADLAFVTGRRVPGGADSESGLVVVDGSPAVPGDILGIVEVRDLQRVRILERVVRRASKRPRERIAFAEIMTVGERFIPDEAKRAKALADVDRKIASAKPATGRQLLAALGKNADRIRLAGREWTATQVDRQSTTVNLSVYLGTSEFWESLLPRITDDNAQQEYYLTDVVNLAAEERRRWRLAQHVIADPAEVMGFNSPDELLRIEDVFRRRVAVRGESRPALPRGMIRAAGEWLNLFEQWPPALRRRFAEIYGPGGGSDRIPLFRQALERFIQRFGADRRAVIVRAPGRINLMGRHVDHRGGAVNVMAIDRDVVFVASERQDDRVTLCSADSRQFPERSFSIREVQCDVDWEDRLTYINSEYVRSLLARSRGDWSNYVKASLLRLQQRFRGVRLRGFDAAVAGDIPMAAGLSSSSALVVASAEVAVAFNGLAVAPAELVDLCGEGEWFVGSRGGAADHAAIRLGRRGRLSHIQFLPFRMGGAYEFPPRCRVIIAHSGLDARKSDTAKDHFNQKVASYEFGLMLLKDRLPQLAPLLEHVRDLNPRCLNCPVSEVYRALLHVPEHMALAELRNALSEPHRRRLEPILASHQPPDRYDLRGVLLYGAAECERSLAAPALLEQGDVEEFGRLMRISHDGDRLSRWRRTANGPWRSTKYRYDCSDEALLRRCDDLASGDPRRALDAQLVRQPGAYACSLPRIDKMVDIANAVPGVYGAQLGGAGLGGCIMILLKPEAVDPVRAALTADYYDQVPTAPLIHLCSPVAGSGPLAT